MTIKKVHNLVRFIYPKLWARRNDNYTLHCTLALKGGNILDYGFNDFSQYCPEHKFGKYKALKSPDTYDYRANLHSEIDLLKKIIFRSDWHKITLLNIRLDRNGKIVLAMPCSNCLRVLYRYNFKAIYYTIDENTIGKISWKNFKEI